MRGNPSVRPPRRPVAAGGIVSLCGCALAGALSGCPAAPEPEPPDTGQRLSTQFDSCAERLHDVCGQLLMYYHRHRKLPSSLADLKAAQVQPAAPLVCPVSQLPYRYQPKGLEIPGRAGRLLLYDAKPCRTGMRWGIFVRPPKAGALLSTRVIPLPDKAVVEAEAKSQYPPPAGLPPDAPPAPAG